MSCLRDIQAIPLECESCVSECLVRMADDLRCTLRTGPMQGKSSTEHEERRNGGTNQSNRGNKVALAVLRIDKHPVYSSCVRDTALVLKLQTDPLPNRTEVVMWLQKSLWKKYRPMCCECRAVYKGPNGRPASPIKKHKPEKVAKPLQLHHFCIAR
jgi:hypothetical protein